MSKTVIKVENLSKQYRLGEMGTGTISHDFNRWWYQIRGKEDPYLKVGDVNDRSTKGNSEYVWALRNINFEVKQGEVLGIIGKNGAGKSTLLKLLSRVTSPTTGAIKAKGRIASLLEVGTGFHDELTGRENIFLNGAILGMKKTEIRSKLDEIIAFSGTERYIDTPVKRYSSGMRVRLAFAVAAHLEPEILIVDEVLAVGDAEFQNKAIGKMQEVSKGEGRTVLFVSHNMGAVASLCHRVLVLEKGMIAFNGKIDQGIDFYINSGNVSKSAKYTNPFPKETDILSVKILNSKNELSSNLNFNSEIKLEIKIQIKENYKKAVFGFSIKDQKERKVFSSEVKLDKIIDESGVHTIQAIIPANTLVPNKYLPTIAIHVPNVEIYSLVDSEIAFEIEETGTDFFQYAGADYGCVFINCKWLRL